MPVPAAAAIELSDGERATLEGWARRPSSAQALALRSQIVLDAAAGGSNTEIAKRLGRLVLCSSPRQGVGVC
jgi:hypothetical protein